MDLAQGAPDERRDDGFANAFTGWVIIGALLAATIAVMGAPCE